MPKSSQAAAGPRFYAFDKVSKKPFNNGLPDESKAISLEGLDDCLLYTSPSPRDRS